MPEVTFRDLNRAGNFLMEDCDCDHGSGVSRVSRGACPRCVAALLAETRAEERERLHTLLERCHAAIDPETWPDVVADIVKEFDSCGEACSSTRTRIIEGCAREIEEHGTHYPEDVFTPPPQGGFGLEPGVSDRIAAHMARHVCRVLAEAIRGMK